MSTAADPAGLTALLQPQSIAVVGASTSQVNLGTIKLRRLVEYGFPGKLYAIHPKANQVEGVPAVPSFDQLPGPVDYAYITLPSDKVIGAVRASAGMARFVQVASAGFGEVGNHDLERALAEAARESGVRLVGPNCLGLHSPPGRVTFLDHVSEVPGPIAIASQSGGLSSDMIRRGGQKGLRFNAVVSLGNSVDVDVVEAMTHFRADPNVEVVGVYLETLHDGPEFLAELRQLASAKPVVVLRGGVTEQGTRSAASHTGGMATGENVWRGICRQAGVIPTTTLESFLDVLLALSRRHREIGPRLALFGPGGGASVLASDSADRLGFDLVPFAHESVRALDNVGVPAGSSLRNPIDIPVGALHSLGAEPFGEILRLICELEDLHLLLLHMNLHNFLSFTDDGAGTLRRLNQTFYEATDLPVQRVLILRSTGELEIETLKDELRADALAHDLPVFEAIEPALDAYAAIARWTAQWRDRRHHDDLPSETAPAPVLAGSGR